MTVVLEKQNNKIYIVAERKAENNSNYTIKTITTNSKKQSHTYRYTTHTQNRQAGIHLETPTLTKQETKTHEKQLIRHHLESVDEV